MHGSVGGRGSIGGYRSIWRLRGISRGRGVCNARIFSTSIRAAIPQAGRGAYALTQRADVRGAEISIITIRICNTAARGGTCTLAGVTVTHTLAERAVGARVSGAEATLGRVTHFRAGAEVLIITQRVHRLMHRSTVLADFRCARNSVVTRNF